MIKNLPKNRFAAIVALFISLLMPTMAKAQEAYAVEDGATLTFYYDNQRATRTGTVYGIDQKQESNNDVPAWAGAGAGQYNDRITKAVFDSSFQKYLPSSTSYWLYNCRKIAAIEGIENLKTENVTDMGYMFRGCSSLTSLDLSNFNTANVTDMRYMFSGCNALTSLDVSDFNTERVTDMSTMFYNCKALTSLDVSSFNTQNVTDMNWMFRGCSALTSLDVSGFKTENVTNMSYMFRGCSALTSLDLSNFNTEKVTNMCEMFYNCSALTSLDLTNFNTAKVTDMSEMFSECNSLKTIYCNDTWTCGMSTNMFAGCTSLKGAVAYDANYVDVSMANPETGYFTTISIEAYAVENGTTLTFHYDDKRDTRSGTLYTELDEHQWTGADITKVVFNASFKKYLPTSTASWFQDCTSLETIEGIENLNTENVTDMSSMFSGCSALTELDVTDFNTSNVTDMSNMFNGCSALTTIYCKDIWTCAESTDMFKGCTSLKGAVAYDASKTDVTMANPVTGYFTCDIEAYAVEDGTTLTFYYDKLYGTRTGTVYGIGQKREDNNNYPAWAGSYFEYNDRITKVVFDASFKDYRPSTTESWFYNCRKIETIERIDNLNTANVTNMGQLFSGCNALTSLDLSNFNTENVTDMNTMFYNCKALTSLDVSSFNTQNVTDMHWMFRDCSALTSLDLSNFITEKVTNMNFMFGYCYALTTLDISNFNTENVTDMNNMFYNCSALTTICCNDIWTCSSSSNMFLGCSSLVGAVPFNSSKVDVSMANPYTGYFTATIEFEAYAVEDGTTLTFYNDGKRDTRSGTVYTALNEHKWSESEITKVVFDVSFIIYLPTSTASWFQDCSKLETIEGIENLNTENVTDMSNMFNGCSALTELDVTDFNTSNVTDMSNMFNGCSALTKLDLLNFNAEKVTNMSSMFSGCSTLTTICCEDTWTCDESTDMFKGCTSLKGAADYDASKVDVSMANPETGYFMNGEAYVVENDTTLTFYYDWLRNMRTGTVYDINQTHSGTTNPIWASSGWGNYNDNITKVVFDASFKDYRPSTTESWFYNCRKIETIEGIENLNTENVTHMGGMFWGCESLTELDVTGFNTAKVTNMLGTFYGCSSLTELDVTGFVTDNVTIMDGMFNRCKKLTTIDVTGFNTENVTDMHNMFLYCFALEWLDLSNFNTEKVTDMTEMFLYCGSLKTLYCNDTWKCDVSTDMFKGCTSLKGAVSYSSSKTDVSMANPETGYFTTCSVEKEAYAAEDGSTLTFYYDKFRASHTGTVYDIDQTHSADNNHPIWASSGWGVYNDKITKVVFDASFKDYRPSTTENWFYNCRKITAIEGIENLNTENVTHMGSMFWGCESLTELDVTGFNTEKVTNMLGTFYGCGSLTELDVTGFVTDNVTIMDGMFNRCKKLTTIDVTGFNTENVTDMHNMFLYCFALEWLDLSNFNTEKVIDMSYMFLNCSALKTIYCNDTWTCSKSEYMFSGCTSLKGAVSYSSSNKTDFSMANPETGYFTATTIEAYAVENGKTLTFYNDFKRATHTGTVYDIGNTNGNTYITKAVFDDSFKTYLPTSTASWFQDCSKLETIEGIENLNTENVTDMSNMFNGCSALTELDVTGFNTENVTDMGGMFRNCSSLSSLDVSKFNTSKVTNMGSMFDGCRALTTIYCNDTWSCDKSTDMFYGCTSLVGAVAYDANYVDVTMANPETGYFTKGGATSVSAINTDNGNRATVIYNLHGIKMQDDFESLPAGIYIVNGKKVIKR